MAIEICRVEVAPGTFSLPMEIGTEEVVLTSIGLEGRVPGERIRIRGVVDWHKPMTCDIGDLLLTLRYGGLYGSVLQWQESSCFISGRTIIETFVPIYTPYPLTVCLTAKSEDRRAIVVGPILLTGALV